MPRDARRNSAAAAELLDELEGGKGPFIGSAIGLDVPPGFEVKEYVVSGTAAAYRPTGPLTPDGRWPFEADSTAEYRTRILVRRPSEPATASGTVVLEWLNVSGGADSNPEWHSVMEEIIRRGHVWVGVSAQRIGVAGGAVLTHPPSADEAHDVAGRGLTALDPARYGSLLHPGDGYSFDIFTQVARALRDGGPATAGMKPDVVLAAGESQSAFALTTYYNGVEPLAAGVFDGFLLHSRSAISLPLVGPGEAADVSRSFGRVEPSVFRDDVDAPVLVLQAEGDVIGPLNSVVVRQPDTDTLRLWEVAGTAHADVHLLGPTAKRIDCGVPINNGPMHVVAKAALHRLEAWIRTGDPPPSARAPRGDRRPLPRNPPRRRRDRAGRCPHTSGRCARRRPVRSPGPESGSDLPAVRQHEAARSSPARRSLSEPGRLRRAVPERRRRGGRGRLRPRRRPRCPPRVRATGTRGLVAGVSGARAAPPRSRSRP